MQRLQRNAASITSSTKARLELSWLPICGLQRERRQPDDLDVIVDLINECLDSTEPKHIVAHDASKLELFTTLRDDDYGYG